MSEIHPDKAATKLLSGSDSATVDAYSGKLAGPSEPMPSDPTNVRVLAGEICPPPLCEDALALTFSRQHANNWRYVAAWGQWLGWDNVRWKKEETLEIFDLARILCRHIDAENPKKDLAKGGVAAATVAAVERLARADRRHAATSEQWDSNLWALNTPRGIVNLKTGELGPHDRAAHMTKVAAASLGDDCPLWRKFIRDVTNGDDELAQYLARVAGYALTGVTTEHVLFFLYGTGANGKSIFLNTLTAILGEYSTGAPMSTFLESQAEQHPTDLAGLRGARLVTAGEIEKGRRWAEAKIKQLTGGDPIPARFMRQDFFTYIPQFKLLIAGNNKPLIRDVDEGIRRRFHLIPFSVTIPPEKRDHDLAVKLLRERDGILAWAVQGCLEWQKNGLQPPARVLDATEEYLESEDALGRWIEELCFRDPNASPIGSTLFASWKTWCDLGGEFVGTLRKFSDDLAKRGFNRWKSGNKRGFKGIALRGQETQGDML